MSFVLDASMALGWIYHDESSPAAGKILDQAHEAEIWVPGIWHLEVANSLQLSVDRRRIDGAFRDKALALLARLRITVDAHTHSRAWIATIHLAERFRLTTYDACYLELAERLALPLATLDQDLREAVRASGLELLGA